MFLSVADEGRQASSRVRLSRVPSAAMLCGENELSFYSCQHWGSGNYFGFGRAVVWNQVWAVRLLVIAANSCGINRSGCVVSPNSIQRVSQLRPPTILGL